MNYAGRLVGKTTGNNGAEHKVLTLSLPKNACEVRFRVMTSNSKNQFAYSFEPRYDNISVVPNEVKSSANTDYWLLAQTTNAILTEEYTVSEDIIIRSPTTLPGRINFLVWNSGTNGEYYVFYQIIGGKNNGY